MTISPALLTLGAIALIAAALYGIRMYQNTCDEIDRLKRLNDAMNQRKM